MTIYLPSELRPNQSVVRVTFPESVFKLEDVIQRECRIFNSVEWKVSVYGKLLPTPLFESKVLQSGK